MADWFGNKGKPSARGGRQNRGPKVNTEETPARGKHDHDSGVNPTMGSVYKPKHEKKDDK